MPRVKNHRADHRVRPICVCSRSKGQAGKEALDRWPSWAQRCRQLQRKIGRHRDTIDAALQHGLSQGLIEEHQAAGLDPHGFGFRSPEALIALGMLALGGYRPPARPSSRMMTPSNDRRASNFRSSSLMRRVAGVSADPGPTTRSPATSVALPRVTVASSLDGEAHGT